MAYFILLPDGVTGTNEWLNDSGGTAAATDVDYDNADPDTAEYITENTSGHEITFTMDNSPVSSAEISSITDVQIFLKARHTAVGRNTFVYISQTGGAGINTINNGTDTITVAYHASDYTLYSGTAETTYNGLSVWNKNLNQLNTLEVKLDKWRNTLGALRISYLYVVVNYLPTVHANGIENADLAKINGIPMSKITKVNGV